MVIAIYRNRRPKKQPQRLIRKLGRRISRIAQRTCRQQGSLMLL
jgi:hypothetical protein